MTTFTAVVDQEHEAWSHGPTATRLTKVLIADDHPLVLAGVRRTLDHADDLEVVGEASNGEQVLALIERRSPQIVLLDLNMPGLGGAELIARIRLRWPAVRVVVLSAEEARGAINSALEAGASAYIVKSVNPIDLASVIRQVAGGVVFHAPTPKVAQAIRGEGAGGTVTEVGGSGHDLTDRERTILTAIASGRTTASISRELWVSEHTVKFHLTNIYRKLGVSNRAGAVRYAIEHGLG